MQTSNLLEKNLLRDENVEVSMVYVTFLNLNSMPIYQVRKTQIALLVIKKAQILSKYLDFLDVFLEKEALILPEITEMNQ